MQSYTIIYQEGVIILLNQDVLQKYYIYLKSELCFAACLYLFLWNSLRYRGSR
ncbi:hypothetical protein EDB95_0524 [Dinghuibacter silviterrae]|uniref:Uncharacterized protein n=1 Tax=Dinghuibacter silviterrae TaxID=1539049 RepID=A0A4R8DQ32_9BACT|nr:hypothetical protein EDB95_0524 [Dinghuibacter silviterrae]